MFETNPEKCNSLNDLTDCLYDLADQTQSLASLLQAIYEAFQNYPEWAYRNANALWPCIHILQEMEESLKKLNNYIKVLRQA